MKNKRHRGKVTFSITETHGSYIRQMCQMETVKWKHYTDPQPFQSPILESILSLSGFGFISRAPLKHCPHGYLPTTFDFSRMPWVLLIQRLNYLDFLNSKETSMPVRLGQIQVVLISTRYGSRNGTKSCGLCAKAKWSYVPMSPRRHSFPWYCTYISIPTTEWKSLKKTQPSQGKGLRFLIQNFNS